MATAVKATRSRGPGLRRVRDDRRTKGRLRELCEEVLASYRLAQGEDLVTQDDRDAAEQYLRSFTPRLA